MSRPSAAVARQRVDWTARERSSFDDPSPTQQPIAYEILLRSDLVIKTRRFSTAC